MCTGINRILTRVCSRSSTHTIGPIRQISRAEGRRREADMAEQLHGIMAEFDTATELVDAARRVRDAGYVKTDAFSPFPLHEIDEALGIKRSVLPYLILAGALTGTVTGFALE